MTDTPLTLGTVLFSGFEVPEAIDGLGGTHSLVITDFPGGGRSLQTFGSFPREISWKGHFTGSLAFPRMVQVDRMRVTGTTVQLTYGPFAYLGVVADFEPRPKSQWLVPYTIRFTPVVDQGAASAAGSTLQPSEAALNQQLNAMADLMDPLNPQMIITAATGAVLLQTVAAVQQEVRSAGGLGKLLLKETRLFCIGLLNDFIATAAVDAVNLNPLIASPALDAITYATVSKFILQQPTAPKWQLRAINPDLGAVAQQYYGDSSQWRTIAQANGLNDMQPVGDYNLNIPSNPS